MPHRNIGLCTVVSMISFMPSFIRPYKEWHNVVHSFKITTTMHNIGTTTDSAPKHLLEFSKDPSQDFTKLIQQLGTLHPSDVSIIKHVYCWCFLLLNDKNVCTCMRVWCHCQQDQKYVLGAHCRLLARAFHGRHVRVAGASKKVSNLWAIWSHSIKM